MAVHARVMVSPEALLPGELSSGCETERLYRGKRFNGWIRYSIHLFPQKSVTRSQNCTLFILSLIHICVPIPPQDELGGALGVVVDKRPLGVAGNIVGVGVLRRSFQGVPCGVYGVGAVSYTHLPEGTRYKGEEGGAGEFKAGAFRIAIKTGAPVVPVAISGARGLFEAHGNRATPGSIHIRILPPIRTVGMSKAEQKQLPEAVRQTILAQL